MIVEEIVILAREITELDEKKRICQNTADRLQREANSQRDAADRLDNEIVDACKHLEQVITGEKPQRPARAPAPMVGGPKDFFGEV